VDKSTHTIAKAVIPIVHAGNVDVNTSFYTIDDTGAMMID
jgi:hypothetical protein